MIKRSYVPNVPGQKCNAETTVGVQKTNQNIQEVNKMNAFYLDKAEQCASFGHMLPLTKQYVMPKICTLFCLV